MFQFRSSTIFLISALSIVVLAAAVFTLNNRATIRTRVADIEEKGGLAAAPSLSQEDYEQQKEGYLQILTQQSPREALAMARKNIAQNAALARSCHQLVHDIGHAAYKKYGDIGTALQYGDSFCNAGYTHGIIEAYFSEIEIQGEDIFDALLGICAGSTDGSFLSWQCNHGVGHGLMFYTGNDVPKSVELCGTLLTEFAIKSCVNGVYMENALSDGLYHLSSYTREDDPAFPCQEQPEAYKEECYVNAPTRYLILNPDSYTEALAWCRGVERAYRSGCALGVGYQALKDNINNPTLAEAVCASGARGQIKSCLHGLVSLLVFHYGSLEPAREYCETESFYQKDCLASIQSNETYFTVPAESL